MKPNPWTSRDEAHADHPVTVAQAPSPDLAAAVPGVGRAPASSPTPPSARTGGSGAPIPRFRKEAAVAEDPTPTRTLISLAAGSDRAADDLLPMVYDELRGLAGRYLSNERPGHTLHPTELVHEAYFRLVDIRRIDWQGKTHFYAMAARQMRRLLVEHARAKSAKKRGSRPLQVTFDEGFVATDRDPVDVMDFDHALGRLAELAPRAARVAEMKLFSGLLVKEIAFALDVSDRTVKSDWRFARTWLTRELSGSEPAR